jgi:nucleotide-binding universal stress UspA family protein
MTRTVMVAVEGSPRDAIAFPVAGALAGLAEADIHLVHVIDALGRRAAAHAELLGVQDGAGSGRRAVEARITHLATGLAAGRGQITWDVLESADVARALIERAAGRDTVVVVMATRAASRTERALLGSVADRVVRECPVPVVVVPPGAAHLEGRKPRFQRVLIPLDGSDLGARALDLLLGLPGARPLEYVLIEVVRDAAGREAAEARLAATAVRVRARGVTSIDVAVLENDDPVPVIIDALREMLIDAIAMSTRGRSGLRRLMLGSVAEGVVRASEVPVLLVTPANLGRGGVTVHHPALEPSS